MRFSSVMEKVMLLSVIAGATAVVSLTYGGFALSGLSDLIQSEVMVERQQRKVASVEKVINKVLDMQIGIRGYLLMGTDDYLSPFRRAEEGYNQYLEIAKKESFGDETLVALLNQISRVKDEWIGGPVMQMMMARRRFNSTQLTYEQFVEKLKENSGKKLQAQLYKISEELDTHAATRLSVLKKEGDQIVSQAKNTITYGLLASLGLSLLTFLLALVFGKKLVRDLLSDMWNLRRFSEDVVETSSTLANSSTELAEANFKQASALQELAASSEEISKMIDRSSQFAVRAGEVSDTSYKVTLDGKSAVQEMINANDQIKESNEMIDQQIANTNDSLAGIVKIISEISEKTKVINDIVFQTKLLSFNASVEAARAGDHGKGFAVVAEEVGNLAQMSGNAAKDINIMLQKSVTQVESIAAETKEKIEKMISEGNQRVENGAEVSKRCEEIFDKIVSNVSEMTSMMKEIVSASQEQSLGINEITKAIGELDQTTHSISISSEQSSKTGSSLKVKAHEMLDLINVVQMKVKYEPNRNRGEANSSDILERPSKTWPSKTLSRPLHILDEVRKQKVERTQVQTKVIKELDGFPSSEDPKFQSL